ncbi:MAG: METTL5 family protein [Thermoplasmatota archaeon]
MRKRRMEMLLSSLKDTDRPILGLEQYRTSSRIVCDMLYEALERGDIEGRSLMELGCGSAPFAIGAALLGARPVYGLDKDPVSLEFASWNIELVEKKTGSRPEIELLNGDITDPGLELPSVDTVMMNPPFGSQRRNADRPFVERAVSSSHAVYSIHNGNSMDFLKKLSGALEVRMEVLWDDQLELPHRYDHHRTERSKINIIVVRYNKA